MTNVAGVFDNKAQAHEALSKLLDAGFKKDDISIIVSDNARHVIFSAPADDEGTRTAKGGAAGALFGGAVGALLAGLTLVGTIAVPGAGLLAAGPLVGVLSGAGAGAAVGGLSGVLVSQGFAVDEAQRYEDEIKHGKAVVVVHTDDKKAAIARSVLQNSNASVKAA